MKSQKGPCHEYLNITISKSHNSAMTKPINLKIERSLPLPNPSIMYTISENLLRKLRLSYVIESVDRVITIGNPTPAC